MNIEIYLNKLDTDDSGVLSEKEFKLALLRINVELTDKQISDLMDYCDVNKDKKLTMAEFKAIIYKGLQQEYHKLQQMNVVVEPTNEEARIEICKFISDYIKKKDTTLLEFTAELDVDKNDNISQVEFENFFKNTTLKPASKEVKALFEALDPQKTGRVTKRQFIDIVGKYIKERPTTTNSIERSLKTLANYIVENKMDAVKFFNKIDTDRNGFLETKELKEELTKIGLITSDVEMNNLLSYFDDSGDGRVNIKEFELKILSYITAAKQNERVCPKRHAG